MKFKTIGQIAGVVMLASGLVGCIDVAMDVSILSETEGKVTTTMTMGADFYGIAKAGMTGNNASGGEAFCEDEGDVLTENADGSATCTSVSEGTFDQLEVGDSNEGATFEVVGPGLVKATFSTAEMSGEVTGGDEPMDEQTKAMMVAFFEGHFVTLKVSGNEVVESNMTIADDKTSAELKIPFLDLINDTAQVPAELYAVVKVD